MPSEFRQYDEHGFPIAPRFVELAHNDDERPRRPAVSVRAKRWVILGLIFGLVIPIVFGPKLVSFGRDLVAQWYSSRAQKKFLDHDRAGALQELSCAIDWCPHDFELRLLRANWRSIQNDLAGSADDWTECIRLLETAGKRPPLRRLWIDVDYDLSRLYGDRGWIYVRLGRTKQALDDVNKAVELSPSAKNLNLRAYSRAILNVELNEGLADIDKAMAEAGGKDPEMLDTRGYLLHLLNRNDEAMEVMQRAIDELKPRLRREFDPARLAQVRDSLAVMYHHLGLIHQQLGHNDESQSCLALAERLGYNPAAGVL